MGDATYEAPQERGSSWWGVTPLPRDALRGWRIGPYALWVRAGEREWRLWRASSGDAMTTELELAIETDESRIAADASLTRVGLTGAEPVLGMRPALADRDVVVRPDIPVVVPAGARIELYVTTPVWVVTSVGKDGPMLLDEPSHRLSDTWFGPNTLTGELAYAIRTASRLDLADVPRRPHRAITKLTVINEGRDQLPVDRLKVPVTGLAIYADGSGGLWTDHVTLERRLQPGEAAASVSAGPGVADVQAHRIAEPRVATGSRFTLNAFGRLFGV